jgi:Tfp pilus assembly protein PilN
MLRTNLSTRPFYNIRLVQVALGALAVIVLGVTVFNVLQVIRLSASEGSLGVDATTAEAEAARLRDEAARLRSQINPRELEEAAAATREANAIIDRRTFSWIDLLAHLEATLPPRVRVTRVQPQAQGGAWQIVLDVQAREVEDLDAFLEALEAEGAFTRVLATQQQATEDGFIQAIVEGTYQARRQEADSRNAAGGAAGTTAGPQGQSNRDAIARGASPEEGVRE